MRTLLILAVLGVLPLAAEDKWVRIKSGPFEVWTNGPEKHAKQRLAEAEQFRHALTNILGKQELKSVWPIRILAVKGKMTARPLELVRDGYLAAIPNEQSLGPEFRRIASRLFIDANTKRYPLEIDQGLGEVLSALEVNGTKLTLGAPPVEFRSAGWVRVHLMVTDDAFAGRMRVYLSNVEQGADESTACRNSFEKSEAEVNRLVKEHAALRQFEPRMLSGRTISAERDYYAKTLPPDLARIAEVDAGMSKAASLADLKTPESFETQGHFAKAVEAGSTSARAWRMHAASLEELARTTEPDGGAKPSSSSLLGPAGPVRALKDPEAIRAALKKAAELNPLWGEPHAALARLETVPGRAAVEWKLAASLEIRNAAYWRSLAITYTEMNQFGEAGKAWTGAERAAASPEERAQLKKARIDLETQRADFLENERTRQRDEQRREIEGLKAAALLEIRKAEANANDRLGATGPAPKVEQWWEDPKGEKISGTLTKVDCLNGLARVVVSVEGKNTMLLIRDPGKIALVNSKEANLGCGPQNPPKPVVVEYAPKKDAKYGTIGEVLTVEFRSR